MAYRMPQPDPIDSAELQRHIADLASQLYGDNRPPTWAPSADSWNRWQERRARGLPRARSVVVGWYGMAWADRPAASEASEWSRLLAEFGLDVPRPTDVMWHRKTAQGQRSHRNAGMDAPLESQPAQPSRRAEGILGIERWRELRTWCPRLHGWVVVGRMSLWELR